MCRCGARSTYVPPSPPPADSPLARTLKPLLLAGLLIVVGAVLAVPAVSRRSRQAASPSQPQPAAAVTAAPAPVATPPTPEPPAPPPPAEPHHDEPAPLEDVVARVLPAVASIQSGTSRGTGFFVQRDTVITNAHVVGGQSAVKLQVGERSYVARVATVSTGSDLAVLKLDQAIPTQVTLELGSASQARVGQEVIAIGSALGVLSNTVTRGIVSAVRQVGSVTLVQTDAAINPGNSGGPLLDRNGVVIGVNSMAVSKQTGEGVAFAVAINHAQQLLEGGRSLAAQQTPLNGLQQLFTPPGASAGDADEERTRGERELSQALTAVAREADQLDAFWTRYGSSCISTSYPRGSRPWFGVFVRGGVTISQTSVYDCASWLQTVSGRATDIRTATNAAILAARRAGVFPGTIREALHEFRLDWDRE
jgi:S1-C subfamily serine protease